MEDSLFNQNSKRSLVLSGGGMRLSYQAGVLLALQENGFNFSHVDATSGGSMNLSMLLSGLSPSEMCERWDTLDVMKSVSLLPLSRYIEMETLEALGDADGMRKHVFPHLGIDVGKINGNSQVASSFNVLNYGKKKTEVFSGQEMDEDLLVAGMSLPGVFPPVKKGDQVYLDAAFVQDANLMEAVKRGAEEIWLIWGLGNTNKFKGGALNVYVQMLEMSANGALNTEVQEIAKINQQIHAGDSPYGQQQAIKLHVIFPQQPLPLDPDLYLHKVTNRTLVQMGYADAMAYVNSMSEVGLPLTENITAQQPPKQGIRFTEKLEGKLNFAFSDEYGLNENNSPVIVNLSCHIDDIDAFINMQHIGRLTGSIEVTNTPFKFYLFDGIYRFDTNSADGEVKQLFYQAKLNWNGVILSFNGSKTLRDDLGLDMWKDLTTLKITLSMAGLQHAEPIAEGACRMNITDMAKLLASVHATGVDSKAEATQVHARYSHFMLGQTVEVYL